MKKWPHTIKEAKAAQETLRNKVKIKRLGKRIKRIAACDVGFTDDVCVAAICVFSYPDLQLLEEKTLRRKIDFPYIPGFLTFREGPVLEKLFYQLRLKPDILIFDGQGIAHPKQLGIASHIGVILNIPTIGCAKSRLWGEYEKAGKKKGDFSYLIDPRSGKVLGCVLRTRDNVKPVFISPGHLVGIKEAKDIIASCVGKYRLPEPIRCAHSLSIKAK
ncbi:MAG: endonuclease V [Candidatus Omnitrophota bacterium]|nr:MAG: endonuclease V [Candidatus Omnitrophota bacterium]